MCAFYYRLCPRWDMYLFCCNGTRGTQLVPSRDFVSLHGTFAKTQFALRDSRDTICPSTGLLQFSFVFKFNKFSLHHVTFA